MDLKIKYQNIYKGLNSRLDEIQAAVLSVKLKHLDNDNQLRRKIASHYSKNINSAVILPYDNLTIENNRSYNGHVFPIRHVKRDDLQLFLTKSHIQTVIHYPIPPHKQNAYKEWNNLSFPITEQIHKEILSLPISPVMPMVEVDKVIEVINQFFN